MIKRKITKIFSLILTLVLLCASLIIPGITITPSNVAAISGGTKLYAFMEKQGTNESASKIHFNFGVSLDYAFSNQAGDAVSNEYGQINIFDAEVMKQEEIARTQRGEAPLFDYVKVYIRTRNLSAIAQEGDYETVNRVVTLYSTNPYTNITINVNKSDFQIDRLDTEEDTTHNFYVEIYHVEIYGLKSGYTLVEPTTTEGLNFSRIKQSIGADLTVRAQKYWEYYPRLNGMTSSQYEGFENGDNLSQLIDIGHQGVGWRERSMVSVTENSSFEDIVFDLAAHGPNNWYKTIKYMSDHDMLKLGILAEGTAFEPGSVYVDDSFVGVQLFAGDSTKVGAPSLDGVPAKNQFWDPLVTELASWFIQFESEWDEYWAITNQYNGTFEGVTVGTKIDSNVLLSGKLKAGNFGQGGRFDAYVEDSYANLLVIDDLNAALQGGTKLSTRVWSYKSSAVKSFDGTVTYVPVNYRAKVQSATVGDVYYDTDGKLKLGISLRFSEPMQLRRNKDGDIVNEPSMKGYLNKNAANEVTFNYVAGDGTDTFYFETDLKQEGSENVYDMTVTSVKLDTAIGFSDIFDFAPISYASFGNAQNLNLMVEGSTSGKIEVNGWEEATSAFLPCSYDLRTPNVKLSGNATQAVKTTHAVTLLTENINETGKLCYAWLEDGESIPETWVQSSISAQGFQTIPAPSGVTGVRYLYAYAESAQWKKSAMETFGPYYFDNQAPELSLSSATGDNKNRTFTVQLKNNTILGEGKPYAALGKRAYVYVSTDPLGEDVIYQASRTITEGTVQYPEANAPGFTETEVSFNVTIEMLQEALGEAWKNGKYYVFFSISDELGNNFISEPQGYNFDTRDIFQVALDYDDSYKLGVELEEDYYTLNLASASATNPITLTFNSDDVVLQISEFTNMAQKENLVGDSSGIEISQSTAGANEEVEAPVTITFKTQIEAGLYRLAFKNTNAANQESQAIYIYVTNGMRETTGMYEKVSRGTLTNTAVKLPSTVQYHYLTNGGVLRKEGYSNASVDTYFSSESEAYLYVLYREYLDLYAVKLDQAFANSLNNGIYHKASGVTQTAQENQIWIRYKEATWRPNSTSNTINWVYYYYDSSLPLNLNALSGELQSALKTVAATICSYAETVDLVTEEYFDQYGSPTLSETQMHTKLEKSTESKSGTIFSAPVEYVGDFGMFIPDFDKPLATNVIFESANRRVYYRYNSTAPYTYLEEKMSGKTFGQCFNTGETSLIQILELDSNGAREYNIYIDKNAPTLNISWQKQGSWIEQTCTSGIGGQPIRGSDFYINGLEDDNDAFSFVAIYRYTGTSQGDLINVYRPSDFANGRAIRLSDGQYHVHVSDRSGNNYAFVVQIKSEALVCTPKQSPNSYLRMDVNREADEIRRYEVSINNIIVSTDYNEKRFYESGQYRFIIEDIYGNVYDSMAVAEDHTICNFSRQLPTVTWSYQTDNGSFEVYNTEKKVDKVKITKLDDQNYLVSTSTSLRFLPLDGCLYDIVMGQPNANRNSATGWVSLNVLTSFTMRVYYETYPETYVTYTCVVDNTPPKITVSYDKGHYQLFEMDEINEKIASGEYQAGMEVKDFKPTSIGFASVSAQSSTMFVANGERVQARYFKVQPSDENSVKSVEVYLDDELLFTRESDFNNIYLSKQGTYTLIATDTYGNRSSFSFVNEFTEQIQYFVDGEEYSTNISFDNFNRNTKVYEKVEYGNTQTEIRLLTSAEIQYLITDADGTTFNVGFAIDNGVLYRLKYLVWVVEGTNGLEIESITARGGTALESGMVAEIDELGIAIYAAKTNAGAVSLTVRSTDNEQKRYTVEVRVISEESESPYYFKTELSNISSSLEDVDGNPIDSSKPIKVNGEYSITQASIREDIERIEVAYSTTGVYTTYHIIFDGTAYYAENAKFSETGMYHVKIINKFGVQTDYYVVISTGFMMVATVEYFDGTSFTFSDTYTSNTYDFYSSKSVTFSVHSTGVTVSERNNKAVSSTEYKTQGFTEIKIKSPGEYFLTIVDEYNNRVEKRVVINDTTLDLKEEMDKILTNFNENAKRREENYTNQKIHINKDAVLNCGKIAFISIIFNEEEVTVYDQIHEDKVEFDETQLIGALGTGQYTVVFRDCYGNQNKDTVIHYREESTLTILQTTINSLEASVYEISDMLEYGVWTNSTISFDVSATKYELTVDGMNDVTSINYETKTKNEYEVYYLDEYGFEYTFTVHMYREELMLQPAEGMSVFTVSDLLVTKDSVKIAFSKAIACTYTITYTLNNEEEKVYNLGDSLHRDGIYRFKAVDKAGNIATYAVKKDSAVEYRLEGMGVGEIMLNGGVTNGSKVQFYPENADDAYIKKVFHNNEFIEYDDVVFTERGKWELIIADGVGNETYFRFYILSGKMDGFTYRTPYDYQITSVMWEVENTVVEAEQTIKEENTLLEAMSNGKYTVTMKSNRTGDIQTFTFTIDTTAPQVSLVGCEENEKTINNITIKGCEVGDTVYVYQDGELVKTVRITSEYIDPPTISESGKYRIVVASEAGVTTELSFERRYVPNVAGSILIIALALAAVVALLIGLIWRNHSKTDE